MSRKYLPLALLTTCLSMSAFADDDKRKKHAHEDEGFDWDDIEIVLTATGGIAFVDADLSDNLDMGLGTLDYDGSSSDDAQGLWGGFIGAETELGHELYAQLGVSYYWTETDGDGTVTQGIDPAFDTFNYDYEVNSQQILLEGKLLWELTEMWRPYVTVGLGAAINRADSFKVHLEGTPPGTFSPVYDENTETSFSYMVGLGVDAQLAENIRLGIAYRYTDLGDISFGDGELQDGEPFDGDLSGDISANEIVAQLSYLFSL